ncbi:pyridoxamine 5'-phosphate oxidase family protein [Dactylosporangium sp. NPDC049140]|uniref:pyridoxamine 5'-phosphate oxidase family protein n=1 Tax=Dactylosporangium sp. NPDC049140 TaxID=3155647 RepID=UPI0033CD0C17
MGVQRGRPLMPGYGIEESDDGLLDWETVLGRLRESHNYWVSTVRPDGRPHAMPVWAVWVDDAVWFSSGRHSRKIRNLQVNPACTVTTESGAEPVVVDGRAEVADAVPAVLDAYHEKYGSGMEVPGSAIVRVAPSEIFALEEARFARTPTLFRGWG